MNRERLPEGGGWCCPTPGSLGGGSPQCSPELGTVGVWASGKGLGVIWEPHSLGMGQLGCRERTGRVEAPTPGSQAFASTCPAGSQEPGLSSPPAVTWSLGLGLPSCTQAEPMGSSQRAGPHLPVSGLWSRFWGIPGREGGERLRGQR